MYLCLMDRSAAVEAIFERVQPPTTFEETVERLGTAIKVGLLPPGSKLPPERELAEQLDISRSTLRQALTTLVQSGHLVAARGRGGGTFVADTPPLTIGPLPEPERLRDVLDYRVAIETGAALLAAERAQPDDLERMRDQVDAMSAIGENFERVVGEDFEPYRRADIRFHIAMAEAAHSHRLVAAMTEVQGSMSELIALIAHPEEVLAQSNAQHAQMVNLLEARDATGAAELARKHLEGTEHILIGLLPATT
jgi:GntR family transcriptional regulator, transcriptional repressor for pyruvate dehydrogenase complex